jgi:IS1 family transposase
LDCGRKYTDSTNTLAGMRIGIERTAQIITMLCEGLSIRAVSRLADVDKNTILELLLLVGERCKIYMENAIVNVPVKDVSVDELWAFLGCKEKTRIALSKPVGSCGDCYCFIGMERNSRFILAWHIGIRTEYNGRQFTKKLQRACSKDRFQISSDGWRPYKFSIPAILPQSAYGQIIKIFSNKDAARYSPGEIVEIRLRPIANEPDLDRINTSHSERFNLSTRLGLRRFTRLTNGFSRSYTHHEAMIALFFMHYNYCQRHGTLRTTPAVKAGLAEHQWTVAEMIERTANYQKAEPPSGWQAFLDSMPDE